MNPNAMEFVPPWLKQSSPATSDQACSGALLSSPEDGVQQDLTDDNATRHPQHSEPPPDELEDSSLADDSQSKEVADQLAARLQVSESLGNGDHGEATHQERELIDVEKPQRDRDDRDEEADDDDDMDEVHDTDAESDSQRQSDGRKTINLVFIGHVDAGKSTISGHILYLTGEVDQRTMEKYEREAQALGRESWKYAWALDLNPQERAKGKTEEVGRASFKTATRRFIILDAPGHKSFVPHMIGGASQADVGILVISARKGEFETGFERGGQTREHAMLAKTSGVRQLVVVINKMDDPSVVSPEGMWSEQRYEECKSKLLPYLKQVGWRPGDVTWLPMSGLSGGNLKEKIDPSVCPWWQGESFLDTLEHLQPPERLSSEPVRLVVTERYKDKFTVVMGKLETGTVHVGDKLVLMPNSINVLVDEIVLEGQHVNTGEPGDNLRIWLRGVEDDEVRAGDVLCPVDSLVHAVRSFNAKLMILEHRSIITAGYSAVLHIHSTTEEFVVEKLLAELDKKTGEVTKKNIPFAKPGMTIVARLRINGLPICLEPFKESPQLGRFMIRAEGATIAVGVVLKLIELGSEK
mmetsp:Transcript_17002/g.35299  ORF Transcript_17002/g.35299 Transcript_17002/m.35299 type:complete len:582 (-) Transcript_17002:187-1932(-)